MVCFHQKMETLVFGAVLLNGAKNKIIDGNSKQSQYSSSCGLVQIKQDNKYTSINK